MLKEKIFFKNGMPAKVITADIDEYPIHFHDDIEVVYVLEGKVNFRNGYYSYTLEQGDVFIVNDREMHSFESTGEKNMVMMLQMDLDYFGRYYNNLKNCFFVTDPEDRDDENVDVIKSILARIMMEILQKGYGYEHKVIESTHNLIANLITNFQYFVMDDGRFRNESRNKGNKILAGRLNRITDYMYDNYNRKLTLGEIAEREHLSIYYLSHIIKEATGLSFQDLLSYIRVEESERLLLGTDKKIGAIAEETGFSAVRYYIKHFKSWFGMHPLEYRKKYIDKVFNREIDARYTLCSPAEIEAAIRMQVKGVYAEYLDRISTRPIIVDIDVSDESSYEKSDAGELEKVMENPANRILAVPYNRLVSMGENIIRTGENYMVTTGCSLPGPLTGMSILVYNFNENISRSLTKIAGQEDLLRIAERYDEDAEFLIRSNGFKGEIRIIRWKLDRENIIGRIENALDPAHREDPRRDLIDRLAAEPAVSIETVTCADTLSIRSIHKGLGAELILIDSK